MPMVGLNRRRSMELRCAFSLLSCVSALVTGALLRGAAAERETPSGYVHGSVVVVVSTEHEFALAADSRLTHFDLDHAGRETHTDDTEKLFTIGPHMACVVAGTLGSFITDPTTGASLSDAIASQLTALDAAISSKRTPDDVRYVTRGIEMAFDSILGLIRPQQISGPLPLIESDIVSIDKNGNPVWITILIKAERDYQGAGSEFLRSGAPTIQSHRLGSGHRFGRDVLGQPDIGMRLLGLEGSTDDTASQSHIMRKYYAFKKAATLDQLQLDDAVALSKELVEATIAEAPPSAGVGGPIDVATVTAEGVRWIQRKAAIAPSNPPWGARFFGAVLDNSGQDLDDFACVRCTFRNSTLTYDGHGAIQLIEPKFEGTCVLRLEPSAQLLNPKGTEEILSLTKNRCRVIQANLPGTPQPPPR
jgi:hypothetical protein